jgi:OPA family glycerol-3-phosphate transporter-like MFS transporter/OPA family sugar phosphate sensor protein UhpC-like MFS transporter
MCLVEMALTAICLIAIHFLPEGSSPVLMLVLLALAGFFLYGPQALYCVVTGKHATKKAASAAGGLIGLMCYASVLFTGFGIGFLSDTFGQDFWNNLFLIMAGVSVISSALMIPIWNIKDDGYVHE